MSGFTRMDLILGMESARCSLIDWFAPMAENVGMDDVAKRLREISEEIAQLVARVSEGVEA